ncbi:MAG TPA: alpha-amylase family glycosyl hydrolase [Pyrinomonadaceae bacterium]|jgi:alpha-amylase
MPKLKLRPVVALGLCACLVLCAATRARAQNDTMMQAFYWDVPTDDVNKNGSWWNNLAARAPEIKRAGFTAVWTPPPSKGNFGIYDMGYGLFDHFDLGNYNQKGTVETRFGSRAELRTMITLMHAQGLEVYTDTVLNHVFTDYHELEVNPAVAAYIAGEAHNGANLAYPVNEVVWRIPAAPAGDYYFQVKGYNLNCSDQTQRGYELYATWTNPNPAFPYEPNIQQTPPYNFETEPNNGAGQSDDFPASGARIWAFIDSCGDVDEYKLTLAQTHDINLILDAKSGTYGSALGGASPNNGYRILHAYGPGGVDFAQTSMQVLTYTGIDYAAKYGVTHTGAGEQNWTWNYTHFHPVDAADYLQADCCDDVVVPNAKIFGQDFNTFDTRADVGVQPRLKLWGQWLVNQIGFDGYRLDFVRGYQEDFIADWIKAMPKKTGGAQRYVVGEYFSGNKFRLKSWVQAMAARGADADVFDFNLKFTLNGLANGTGASFDMRTLNHAGMVRDNTGNALSGLDVNTFVDNHDTGKDAGQWVFKDWQLPYAYILFAEGRPTVFYPHFYNVTQQADGGFNTTAPASLQADIRNLINYRRTFLDGDMVVNSETGNPDNGDGTSTNVANVYVARRRGNAALNKPGAILVLNNHDTATKCLYVDNAPAGSGYTNWANSVLRDLTGHEPNTQVFADGRVQVCAPPRGYAVYVPTTNVPQLNVELSGHVMLAGTGAPIVGATVALTGSRTATTTTDTQGNYFFNVPAGGNYTVTPAKQGFNFTPPSYTVNDPTTNQTALNFSAAPVPPPSMPGQVLISEFRLDGPNGVSDEFVELYNNTDSPVTVASSDGSAGWSVGFAYFCQICGPDPDIPPEKFFTLFTVPNGTVIPARGHFLWTNNYTGPYGTGYSLKDYGGTDRALGDASGNFFNAVDYPDDYFDGLALFTTANQNNWSAATRLDAVGGVFNSDNTVQPLFVEGTGLQQYADYYAGPNVQYSWVRRLETGTPQDTNNNADDFVLVSNVGSFVTRNGVGPTMPAILGAPGPENLSSPIQRNATVKPSLIEPQQSSTAPPNRVRDTTPNVCGNANLCAQGTLDIRRRFKNSTGQPITRLRFRVVDITTLNTPNPGGAQADLRLLDSSDLPVTTSLGQLTVRGTLLEQPPTQASGGGLNTSAVINLPGAIQPNVSVDVRFLLGVQTGGRFRFLVNVEAGNTPPGAQKGERTSKQKLND